MKIDYLYEGSPFGSYKNKRSAESVRKTVAKELGHVAKSALLDNLYTKIEVLINEYFNEKYKIYLNNNNSGLYIVVKNGNKKGLYVHNGFDDLEDSMPVLDYLLKII